MKPDIPQAVFDQARQALTARWSDATQLPYNATLKQTEQAVRETLKKAFPQTRFRVSSTGRTLSTSTIKLAWTRYPDAPDIGQVDKVIGCYMFRRQEEAEQHLRGQGMELSGIPLLGLLKDMWGVVRGVNCRVSTCTADQLARWERREARKRVNALKTFITPTTRQRRAKPGM